MARRDFHQALAGCHLGFAQPDCCKWGGASATLPVARASVALGRAYCPHFLGGGIGQLASLHLLAAVRGGGMLEMDANPNLLRSLLIDPVLRVTDGMAAVPAGSGLGIEPEVQAFECYVASRPSRDA